ncbi:MAG TPA: biotin--[acetyl-CoA-carboxylase] ligase [Chitinophagaceae bacterium]|nr:biotin--[acetyl-CoA-carboxylase] ligase [Chitinophagaceae bacterium]
MPFVELQSVDSTNNYARSLVKDGSAQDGMAIFAHEQTAGKGQRGNSWQSEKDSSIALSILVSPLTLGIKDQFQLNACVAVSLYRFFSAYAGEETTIKWPNDLYWQDRKAGGILIENIIGSVPGKSSTSAWKWSIIGIGININETKFPSSLPNPVSLRQITGKTFHPLQLAKELCKELNDGYAQLSGGHYQKIYEQYNEHLYKKNQLVKLKKGNRVFEASILAVTKAGKLLTKHSIEEEFDFGEVQWMT